jgi:hypothetical protein
MWKINLPKYTKIFPVIQKQIFEVTKPLDRLQQSMTSLDQA